MGLLKNMAEALGHVVREEGQWVLQPELPLVAGSDALSSLWLLDHLYKSAVFKLFMQSSCLLVWGFIPQALGWMAPTLPGPDSWNHRLSFPQSF